MEKEAGGGRIDTVVGMVGVDVGDVWLAVELHSGERVREKEYTRALATIPQACKSECHQIKAQTQVPMHCYPR